MYRKQCQLSKNSQNQEMTEMKRKCFDHAFWLTAFIQDRLDDRAERHDQRLWLFFSPFLFPPKKEKRRRMNNKNRDQKSCLSARSDQYIIYRPTVRCLYRRLIQKRLKDRTRISVYGFYSKLNAQPSFLIGGEH